MKTQFILDESAREELQRIAKKAGVSPKETLMRALGTFDWLLDRLGEGYEVGAGRANEDFRAIDIRGEFK